MPTLCRQPNLCPSRLFTGSFCPNRIRRNEIRKISNLQMRKRETYRNWKRWSQQRQRLDPGIVADVAASRRAVMIELASKLGPFSGKNCFQLGRKFAQPASMQARFHLNRNNCCLRDRFSLCGPGARSMLNLLEGWPADHALTDNDVATHEVYNTLLLQWHRRWKSICKQLASQLTGPLQEQALFYSRDVDEVGFQFLLCELSKKVKYTETGNIIYERGYDR